MEAGIEHRNLGDIRQDLIDGKNPLEVGRVMERCQFAEFFDIAPGIIVNAYAGAEKLSSMGNTMAYGGDLGDLPDHSLLGVFQRFQDQVDAVLVIGNIACDLIRFPARDLVFELAVLDADPVELPFREQIRILLNVDYLVFDGRTSTVQDKNFHF